MSLLPWHPASVCIHKKFVTSNVPLCFTSRRQGITNGGAIILTEYDKLLEDARVKAEAFKSAARDLGPQKMYWAEEHLKKYPTHRTYSEKRSSVTS
jgi:hypothetical protein